MYLPRDECMAILYKHLKRNQLFAYDFPIGPVTVTLLDGSFFCWYAAFAIADADDGNIYIFTEHYGYHVFEAEFVVFKSGPAAPKPPKKSRKP